MAKWFEMRLIDFYSSHKNVKVLSNWLRFDEEKVLKMHGPKSKFITKAVQVLKKKQEEFWKGGMRFFEIKEDGRRWRGYPKA